MKELRVLLADDHPIVRAGVAALLRRRGTRVVGEAADGMAALELATQLQPDIVLMDVAMKPVDGMRACAMIRARLPDVRDLPGLVRYAVRAGLVSSDD